MEKFLSPLYTRRNPTTIPSKLSDQLVILVSGHTSPISLIFILRSVFLGYSGDHKGYRCLSPSGRSYTSRHVCFNEQDFPFSTNFLHNPPAANNEPSSILSWLPIPQFLSKSPQTNPVSSTIPHTESPSPSPSPSYTHPLSDPISPLPINPASSSLSASPDIPATAP